MFYLGKLSMDGKPSEALEYLGNLSESEVFREVFTRNCETALESRSD